MSDLCSVQEQKKGYWIFEEYPDGYYHSECSVCWHWFDEDAYLKQYEICPNCWADMKKKVREMKWINVEQPITVTIYDEEHEEHLVKTMTVEEMIDAYTNEGCPTIYSNPEQESIKWIPHKSVFGGLDERVYTCNKCGYNIGFHVENFCPNCGGKYER